MGTLRGRRIALLEGRMTDALAALVRRWGAEPVCVPAVREEARAKPADLYALLTWLDEPPPPVVVLSTGAAVDALFHVARAEGQRDRLREALNGALTVCRGPKPVGALHREQVAAAVRVPSPYTTQELIATLEVLDVVHRQVVVLHYGERNPELMERLGQRGATARELFLYEWKLPEDLRPLEALIDELVFGALDAVAFTSQVQARHLFQVAQARGLQEPLRQVLNERVVVGSIGPTCSGALRALGVRPRVEPEHPKMANLVEAMVRLGPGTKEEAP